MSSLKFLRQSSDPSGNSCLSERSKNVLPKKNNNNSLFTQRDPKTVQKCITKHLPIRKVASKDRLLPERITSDSKTQSTAHLKIAQAPQSTTAKKQSLIVQVHPNSKASSRNQDTDTASNGISLAGSESTSAQSSAKLNKNNYFSTIIPTLNLCSQKDEKDLNNSGENSLLGSTCQFGSLKPEDKEILVQNYINNAEKKCELNLPTKKFAHSTTAKPKIRNPHQAEVKPFGKDVNLLPEKVSSENPFEKVTLPKAVIDLVEENNNLKIENNKKEELIDYLLTALQKQNQDVTENATSKLSDLLTGPNPLKNKKKIICLNKLQLNSNDRISAVPITTRITRDISIGKDSSIFSRGNHSVRGKSQESAGSQERFSELSSSRQNQQLSIRPAKLPTLGKIKSVQNFPELPEVQKIPSLSPVFVKSTTGSESSPFIFHSRNTPLSQEQISSMRAKSKVITPVNPYGFQTEVQDKIPATRRPRHMLPNGNGIINIFCNPSPLPSPSTNLRNEAIQQSPKWENLGTKAAFDFNGTFNPERFIAMAENSETKTDKIARSSSKKEFPTINSSRYFGDFSGNDKENELEFKPNFKTLIPQAALAEKNIALGNLLNTKPSVGKISQKINRRINSQTEEQSKEFNEASSLASVASRPTENFKKEKFPKEVFTLNIRKKFF